VQREQRKTETNCDAAERSRETLSSGTECDQPDNEQHRRDRGNVNDSTWTISVVPTLAPSMIASAGTRPTRPSAASDVVINPVAVLL
jgi:hypothetical protein